MVSGTTRSAVVAAKNWSSTGFGSRSPIESVIILVWPTGSTALTLTLPSDSDVRLEVYDVQGRHVATLLDAPQTAGEHRVIWDASAVGAGVYFARLETTQQAVTQKLLLIK